MLVSVLVVEPAATAPPAVMNAGPTTPKTKTVDNCALFAEANLQTACFSIAATLCSAGTVAATSFDPGIASDGTSNGDSFVVAAAHQAEGLCVEHTPKKKGTVSYIEHSPCV